MGNAEIFISFLANLLISASKHVTLNQRDQGSSPCAPTNHLNNLAANLQMPEADIREMTCVKQKGRLARGGLSNDR
jgi:hypothetical protein